MVHPFYRLPRLVQWPIAVFLFAAGFLPFVSVVALPALAITAPLWITWATLCFTPLFTLLGVFRYYGPLVLVLVPTRRRRELHSATLFDYLGIFRLSDRGLPGRERVLAAFLEALLAVCDEVERGKLEPDAMVYGTSYFFDGRTASRLGFTLSRPTAVGWFSMAVGALDITLMYSFAHGRLALPPLHRTRLAEVKAARLLEHKPEIERLHRLLAQRPRPVRREQTREGGGA